MSRKKQFNKIMLLLFFLSNCLMASALVTNVDSLKNCLKSEKNDEKKIRLRNLIGEYGGITRITYWDSIIADAEKIKYKLGLAYASFMQSLNYTQKNEIEKAIFYAQTTLTNASEAKDSIWMGYALEHLGSLNQLFEETPTALSYFKEAQKLYKTRKDHWRLGHITIKIAEVYDKQEKNELALKLYFNSISSLKQNKDTVGISLAYMRIGNLYKELGKKDSSLYYLTKSYDSRNGFQDQYYICSVLNSLGEIYFELGNIKRAQELALESEIEAEKTGNQSAALSGAYLLMYKCSKATGDFKKALYYKELQEKIDKVVVSENSQKAIFMQQAKYGYDKQKALDDAEAEKKIELERKEKEKQKLIIVFSLVGVLLLGTFLVFVFNRLRITQKQKTIIETQKAVLENQKQLVEEKQKEILDSIHYAKRIQLSLLTPQKYIERNLKKLKK